MAFVYCTLNSVPNGGEIPVGKILSLCGAYAESEKVLWEKNGSMKIRFSSCKFGELDSFESVIDISEKVRIAVGENEKYIQVAEISTPGGYKGLSTPGGYKGLC